jgi:hypothetical protein
MHSLFTLPPLSHTLSPSLPLLPFLSQDEGTSVDPERPKYYYIAYEILTTERT